MNSLKNTKKWLVAAGIVSALGVTSVAYSGNGDDVNLSHRPKTIVIDNLDNALFTKGDPAMAKTAQAVCGDCHSSDYPMTQPKLNCAGWGKEIVKMANVMGAVGPWNAGDPTATPPVLPLPKATLYQILSYLTDNYGSGGSAACKGDELSSIPLKQ